MNEVKLERRSPADTWDRAKELCRHPEAAPGAGLVALCVAGDGLKAEVTRLYSLIYGDSCAYCGELIGAEMRNQDVSLEMLKAHVRVCPKHPLAAALSENKRLRDALLEAKEDFAAGEPSHAEKTIDCALEEPQKP